MEQVILTTSTVDDVYYEMLKSLLVSMEINGKNTVPIHIDLINGKDLHVKELTKISKYVEEVDLIPLDANFISVTFTRPEQMKKHLGRGYKKIMSIDNDIVINDDITPIWDGVVPSSIKIWDKRKYLPKMPNKKEKEKYKRKLKKMPWITFQGGVYVFGNSPVLRDYYQNVVEVCKNRSYDKGYYDGQWALYSYYLKYADIIKLIPLHPNYNDTDMRRGSAVWHCKHSRHNKGRFRKEVLKYLEIANERLS